MFWHGLSLVRHSIKRRETLVNLICFGWWQTSQERRLQLSLEIKLCLCCDCGRSFRSWNAEFILLWKPSWFSEPSLHKASSQSRRSRLRFHPQVPVAVLLCCAGSGFSGETPARCCLSPCPFFIRASSRPSILLSLFSPLLRTGPPSDWVNVSRVPLKVWCCCNFLRGMVISCIGWNVLSGPVGGLVERQLLSCGLFLSFSISDCKERILVAGLNTDLVRGTKTAKEKRGGGS